MNGCNQKQLLPLAVPSHPLYRIRRNYNDKWDTIEYHSSNDQYICSVGDLWRTWMIPNWLYMSPSDSPDHPGSILYHSESSEVPYSTNHTAIPYRESTGFLQGIPCVVFPPLHALAVYRVWRVQISLKYREIYAFCTGI